MIKLIDKKDLRFNDGYLFDKDGVLVTLVEHTEFVMMLNDLETAVQKEAYLKAQPEATPMPSLDGFVRKSMDWFEMPLVEPTSTEVVDKRVEEALAFAREMDDIHLTKIVNKMLENYRPLFDFIQRDKIPVNYDSCIIVKIDTPTLGNPLELTEEDIVDAVMFIHGAEADD